MTITSAKAGRMPMILKGIDSANRGDLIPAEEVFDRLEAKYRALAEKRGLLS
jgi:hypothetical protein